MAKSFPLAEESWVKEEEMGEEFIYRQTNDHEGKGYLGQFKNPFYRKKPIFVDEPVKENAEEQVVKKKRSYKKRSGAL